MPGELRVKNWEDPDDQELLRELKVVSKEANCTPLALIKLAQEAAKWQRQAGIFNFGPFPIQIEEAEFWPEMVPEWPDWVGEFVPVGSKWEQLRWPDGSITIRLVNPRGLVLAARHIEPEKAED